MKTFFPQVIIINDLERATISYEWDMKEYLLGRIMMNALFILKMKKQVKTASPPPPNNYVSSCFEKMTSAAGADLCIWENRQKTVPLPLKFMSIHDQNVWMWTHLEARYLQI